MARVVEWFRALKLKWDESNIRFDVDPTSPDPADRLPLEMFLQVVSHLDVTTLGRCCLVSKKWKVVCELRDVWFVVLLLLVTYLLSSPLLHSSHFDPNAMHCCLT